MIRKWRDKLFESDIMRYLFFGGLTVLVNLVSFYLLTEIIGVELKISNLISIIVAVLFAYAVNSRFVFCSEKTSPGGQWCEFLKFIGMRSVTLVLEMFGVVFLVESLFFHGMLAKIFIQILVIILNYVFSKWFVFK